MKSAMNPRSSRARRNSRSARGVLRRPKHTSSSSRQNRAESAAAAAETPPTSDAYRDYLHDMDEVEALGLRASALASVSATPHYFENDDDFDQSYCDEVYYSDDDINYHDECEINDDSLILASRTNKIMSGYKDFLSEYESNTDDRNHYRKKILSDGDTKHISIRMAGNELRSSSSSNSAMLSATGGPPILRREIDFDPERNLHSSRDDIQSEAVRMLVHDHSHFTSKKFTWDTIALMVICLVAGVVIGVSLSQAETHDIAQETTPMIGMSPQEAIDDHLSNGDGGPNNEDLPQQLPETKTVATETMPITQVSTTITTPMPVVGVNPQETINHYQSGEINTTEVGSTPQQSSEINATAVATKESEAATAEVATSIETKTLNETYSISAAFITEKYAPQKFPRSMGWDGESYIDSITFCAKQDSYTLCPYEVICPGGPGSVPYLGYGGMHNAWVAMIEILNGWVQIAHGNTTCMEYHMSHNQPPMWYSSADVDVDGDMMPHVLCCKEPIHLENPNASSMTVVSTVYEQDIRDKLHPVWFGRFEGYHGTSHVEAVTFCESVGDMALCPIEAYCPSDLSAPTKLFLNKSPFEGEQWAPVAPIFNNTNVWVSVGTLPDTCVTYEQMYHNQPVWGMDGSHPEMKQNILCCQKQDHSQKEQNIKDHLKPIWIDSSHGWGGAQWMVT